ncbi:MAG: hypothetical protein NXH99_11530 [Rhodobacteraceae bacterium]|nr:hypothetical protein [Paracoccaceae bacterium]
MNTDNAPPHIDRRSPVTNLDPELSSFDNSGKERGFHLEVPIPPALYVHLYLTTVLVDDHPLDQHALRLKRHNRIWRNNECFFTPIDDYTPTAGLYLPSLAHRHATLDGKGLAVTRLHHDPAADAFDRPVPRRGTRLHVLRQCLLRKPEGHKGSQQKRRCQPHPEIPELSNVISFCCHATGLT